MATIQCKNNKNMPKLDGFPSRPLAFVFDLDNTLAGLGKPAEDSTVSLLRKLEKRGHIVISSGKPLYYLCGFARQLGLGHPILMGENGALIQFGVDLPPKVVLRTDYPKGADKEIESLRQRIVSLFPDIWFQPNEVCLTPFPTREREWEAIGSMAKELKESELDVFRHNDSFDFIPKGIDKGKGCRILAEYLGLGKEQIYGFGDARNDIPLLESCGHSYAVSEALRPYAEHYIKSIDEALENLLSKLSE